MSAVLLFLRGGGWKVVAGGLLALALVGGVWRFSHVRYQAGYDDASRKYSEQMAEQANRAAEDLNRANERTAKADAVIQSQLASAKNAYNQGRTDEQASFVGRQGELRSGSRKLLVSVSTCTPASRRQLPNLAGATSGSDGEAVAALPGPIAARLDSRYHDYNELVDQLTYCQAVVQADRAANVKP